MPAAGLGSLDLVHARDKVAVSREGQQGRVGQRSWARRALPDPSFPKKKRTPSPAWSTGEMRARESSGAATGGLGATRTSRTERKQWRWVSILLDQNEAGGSG